MGIILSCKYQYLVIKDTAGQDRYKSIGPALCAIHNTGILTLFSFRRAMGILFVYDVTNPETFNSMELILY